MTEVDISKTNAEEEARQEVISVCKRESSERADGKLEKALSIK
jgi:hypothetical protein